MGYVPLPNFRRMSQRQLDEWQAREDRFAWIGLALFLGAGVFGIGLILWGGITAGQFR